MAFIREKEEIKTGFQEIEPWSSEIDLQTDFVMVYGGAAGNSQSD